MKHAESCTLEVWRKIKRGVGEGTVKKTKNYWYIDCDNHRWQLSTPLKSQTKIGENIAFIKAWNNGYLWAYAIQKPNADRVAKPDF
ncbi:MAG: hypothetical protein LBP62_05700 [Clostridiales bacterium]|jgi:hypothetical protein|nr:hypothetical protein [Clostridiales bacterium]